MTLDRLSSQIKGPWIIIINVVIHISQNYMKIYLVISNSMFKNKEGETKWTYVRY